MVSIWTQTLFSAAELSSILSAVGVIVCFVSTVIFIMRMQGLQMTPSSVVHINHAPVQVNFQKIEVPFTCHLQSVKELPDNGEIQLRVKSNTAYSCQALWGVPADTLRHVLYLPWNEFTAYFGDDNLLLANKLESIGDFEQENCDNNIQIIHLNVDPHLPSLGHPPRSYFPLVMLFRRKNPPDTQDYDSVGALISVFHISDEDCPMSTTILYNCLKQYSGQMTKLHSLYTQRIAPDMNSSAALPVNSNLGDEGACVICTVAQPTRALLPCRHVCLCYTCFYHVDTCPMCRSQFTAFFVTDTKEDDRQRELSEQNLRRHQSFLNNMNGVLNSFLGIN